MLASSFCASRPRDATRRSAAGSTSRRDAAAPRGGRKLRAASAPSQQHQQQFRRSSSSRRRPDGSVPRRWAVDRGSSFEMVSTRSLEVGLHLLIVPSQANNSKQMKELGVTHHPHPV